MKIEIKKKICIIILFIIVFQMILPIILGTNGQVLATEANSDQIEVKIEESWDISEGGDESVIAKFTKKDRTLTISGTGKMKDWSYNATEDWHDTQYANFIEKIVINEGVTNISNHAFDNCIRLESITIPNTITSIGEYAFSNCISLETVNIPDSVIEIGDYAFDDCNKIKEINISAKVEIIGEGIGANCNKLQAINVDPNNKNYSSDEGVFFDKKRTILKQYPRNKLDVENYTIPNTVTTIGERAFFYNDRLKNIIIPDTVTVIEEYAFYKCENLSDVIIPNSVTKIENDVFAGCTSLINIDIPDSVTSIGWDAFDGCRRLKNIKFSKNLKNINSGILSYCDSLIDVDIPENITKIAENAFLDTNMNHLLTEKEMSNGNIEIPEILKRAKTTEDILFAGTGIETENCSFSATEDKIILDMDKIQEGKLAKITITSGLLKGMTYTIQKTVWDMSANEDESVIATLSDDGTLTISGQGKMKDGIIADLCGSMYLINKCIIQEGVTNIGNYTFYSCGVKSIEIADSVTSIGNHAFWCAGITSIEISKNVDSIGEKAFVPCRSLENIHVDSENKNYTSENGVLFNKEKTRLIQYPSKKLDNIYEIPETVVEIGEYAFYECDKLNFVNIPDSVTTMGEYAFYTCHNLQYVRLSESLKELELAVFGGCSSLIEVVIPDNITNISVWAFTGCDSLIAVVIPSSVVVINASFDSESKLTIYCNEGSKAQSYAIEKNISYTTKAPDILFEPVADGIKVTAIEEGAGIGKMKYIWTESTEQPLETQIQQECENETIIQLDDREEGYLWVYVEDSIGNKKIARSEKVQKDTSIPNIEITYNPEKLTNQNVTVTITANEEIQAVEGWTLSSNKKTLTKEYTENTTETITIKDLAGNEAQATIEITNIDKTAPTVNVGYSTKEITEENVIVTITANEEIQAITGWTLSSDKKTLTKEYTENTTEIITIKDLAGNETQANIEISNIDKNLPEITIGDINQDGKIDVTDLLMLKRHLVAGNRDSWKLTGDNLSSADMNENGTVDITDMLMLKRVIVENI